MRLAYKWQAALIASLGLFMAVLDLTIVNVALPQMQSSFHTDRGTITWVVTAYFLAQAAVIPVTGYLSDRFGSKTIFLGALAIFTLGSLLCALAPTEGALIGFRVLQGIGGGALFPTAFAIVFRVFPPMERGAASAVISIPVLLAPSFGPTIGGYLTTTFDWSAVFIVNVPIGVVAVALGYFILRGRAADEAANMVGEQLARGRQKFDLAGLLLSMAGVTALVYGISEAGSTRANGTTIGWGDRTVIAYMAIGIVLLVTFVINELRVSDPVMDLRLFLNYTFAMSNVLIWAVAAFLFGSLFLLPILFENIQGVSALNTGEIFITQGLAAAVATVFTGRFYNKIGPRYLATAGFLLITVGTIGFINLTPSTTGASLQWWLITRGLGLGLTNIPLQTLALSVVSNRAMARATSLLNVTRQVASAIGISVLTTFLTTRATSHAPHVVATFKSTQLAQVVAQAQTACVAKLGQVPGVQACVQGIVQGKTQAYVFNHSFTQGLNDTFVFSMIATGICIALALLVGKDPAVEAAKRTQARGEDVQRQPVMVGE